MYTLKNQRIFKEIIHGTVDQQPKLAAVQLNLYFANDVYLLDHHFIYVHTCVSVQVNATCAGGEPAEVREGHRIPWSWNYRCLEPPNTGAGNCTGVFCRKWSERQNCLF